MAGLAEVFTSPDTEAAIRGFITAFAGFWAADRVVMRRLRALAALDPDVGTVIAARDQRRREGLTVLIGRLPAGSGPAADRAVRMLYALTSFETFDSLAGASQSPEDVVPLVCRLSRTVLEMKEGGPAGGASDQPPKRRGRRCR